MLVMLFDSSSHCLDTHIWLNCLSIMPLRCSSVHSSIYCWPITFKNESSFSSASVFLLLSPISNTKTSLSINSRFHCEILLGFKLKYYVCSAMVCCSFKAVIASFALNWDMNFLHVISIHLSLIF